MGERVRQIGFGVTVVILAALIYFFVSKRSDVGENVLESSLNLLGDKLMAMVPDDAARKDNLTALYDEFKRKAMTEELPPEKVEVVAANILNMSNMEQDITPEQAETLLRSIMVMPVSAVEPAVPGIKEPHQVKPVPPVPPTPPGDLGWRLHTMVKFNEDVHRMAVNMAHDGQELARHIQFKAENGLKIKLDERLRHKLREKKFAKIAEEAKCLERDQMLKWEKDVRPELERELASLHREMESMKVVFKSLEGLPSLESLESLRHLENLRELENADPDSIETIVMRSLKMAGINVDVDVETRKKSSKATSSGATVQVKQ